MQLVFLGQPKPFRHTCIGVDEGEDDNDYDDEVKHLVN